MRYVVVYFDEYYPSGAELDFVKTFSTLEESIIFTKEYANQKDITDLETLYVLDLETMKRVYIYCLSKEQRDLFNDE